MSRIRQSVEVQNQIHLINKICARITVIDTLGRYRVAILTRDASSLCERKCCASGDVIEEGGAEAMQVHHWPSAWVYHGQPLHLLLLHIISQNCT